MRMNLNNWTMMVMMKEKKLIGAMRWFDCKNFCYCTSFLQLVAEEEEDRMAEEEEDTSVAEGHILEAEAVAEGHPWVEEGEEGWKKIQDIVRTLVHSRCPYHHQRSNQ